MTAWSHNLTATVHIRRHALDDDDRRTLLEMVGLISPGSRVMQPDDTRVYHLTRIEARQETHEPNLTKREKGCNTPPGLANLTPVAEQPKPRKRRTVAEGRPTRTKEPKPRRQAECGTPSGHDRHMRLKEPSCQPCRDARAAYQREVYARKKAGPVGRLPAACGTRAGYDRHLYKGEKACDPCRAASAARQRDYYARKRAEKGLSVNPRGPIRKAS